jgi:phenylpropionate dioxygenase-like ring-hydroxylating dioxygenase large terminal subunit
MCLPEVQVGRWGGFVFVNPDPGAGPFEDFVGVLPEHFERWPLDGRAQTIRIAKIFRGNWKVALGAFLEGYHVPATHPQVIPAAADTNIQYDVWGNVSRLIFMQGLPSPECPVELTEQEILDTTLELLGIDAEIPVPDGGTARAVLAQLGREATRQQLGVERTCTDAEMIDIIVYYLFPNFVVWAGWVLPLVYRFRPYGNDPEMSVMEIIMLAPVPEGTEPPPPVPMRWLGPDESFASAPELGAFLSPIYDQDASNIERVQRGLRTSAKPGLTLTNYQESLIRHHDLLLSAWTGQLAEKERR